MRYSIIFLLLLTSSISFAQIQFFPGSCTSDKLFCAYFSPDDVPVSAVEAYLRGARKSIKIATYNMNVNSYIPLLHQKLNQNVKVEFLVDYKLSFESNSVWRNIHNHPNLLKYRVPVLRGGSPQMHNKLIIIDDKIVLTGSANYTYSGLVGNYENVMAIGETGMVRKFLEEFEELKNFSKITCEVMAGVGCGRGEERYPGDFHELMTKGSIPASSLVSTSGVCKGLVNGYGLLTAENNSFSPSIPACFKEQEKYSRLISLISANEKKSSSNSEDKYQVYFSPEDNLEDVILHELSRTLKNPSRAFAYISVNFITNRKLAAKLVEMKRRGIRMKIFFDRGRFEDPNFRASLAILNELGFSRGGDDESQVITIFDNQLVGPYGCNHNKLAVISDGNAVTVLNGSANWSAGAMTKNDENLTVVKDSNLAAIYLREILSQLLVYRYGQNLNSPGFRKDLAILSASVPCLKSQLGIERKCPLSSAPRSAAVISVSGVPAGKTDRVWAWVPELNNNQGGALELFTHETFAGKWVTSIPMPLNATYHFKLFKMPYSLDPNKNGLSQAVFEYEGIGNDRSVTAAPIAVEVIRGFYTWGIK